MNGDTESFHQDDGNAVSNQEPIDSQTTFAEKSSAPSFDACSGDTDANDGNLSDAKENNGMSPTSRLFGEPFGGERGLNSATFGSTSSEVNGDDCSSDSASSSEDECESDDDSVSDPHLSDYERLRLRNIRRNEARLAQLGLLVPGASSQHTSRQSVSQSAFSALRDTSGTKRGGRPSGGSVKKCTKTIEVTRILPRRRAKFSSRHDRFSCESTEKRARTKKSPVKQRPVYTRNNNADDDDDDDSIPPTPIQLSKIIKPQSHQKDFHEDKKFYLKQRRNRRGRPKRDEYVYVCEEVCQYCGGEWGNVIESVENGNGVGVESQATQEAKLIPIAIDLLDDDEVKLIRCKGCKEAFHPRCMMLDRKQGHKLSNGSTNLKQVQPAGNENHAIANDSRESAKSAEEIPPVDYQTKAPISHVFAEDNVIGAITAKSANEGIDSEMTRDHLSTAEEEYTPMECHSSANEDSTYALSPKQDLVDVNNSNGEEPAGKNTMNNYFSFRHPKRCCKCEAMRKSTLEEGGSSGGKRTHDTTNDIGPPSKKRCTFQLEAFLGEKRVLCSVNPVPLLEAVVLEKTIACFITLARNQKRNNSGIDEEDMVTSRKAGVGKGIHKTKRWASASNLRDATTKKVVKIVSKAIISIDNADIQEASIIALRSYVDEYDSTAAVVRAGGLDVIFSAMSYHLKVPNIQVESIKTMTEIVWYCQSLGTELVERGCLDLTILAMECHGTHSDVQKLGCELFRALSYDLDCCNTMFKADVVTAVVASMARNPNELDALTEGSCFIQNMIVVSFDTVSILLKATGGDDIISVLINGIASHMSDGNCCFDFVVSACDVLANLAMDKRGQSRIARRGGGAIFHDLIKMNQDAPEVVQPAMSTLYNLACSSSTVLKDLAKADCISSVSAVLNTSTRDPSIFATSLGFLKELAGVDNRTKREISSQGFISRVLDTIRHCPLLKVQLNAFSLLSSITPTGDKQLSMNTAKTILESMKNFPDEEAIQSGGCRILLQVTRALPQSRALKSLIRSGSGRQILSSVMKVFPKSCNAVAYKLLND